MKDSAEIIYRKEFKVTHGVHPVDALLIVLEGSFAACVDQQTFTAQRGDLVCFHADQWFDRHVLEPVRCIYIQSETLFADVSAPLLPIRDQARKENTLFYLHQAVCMGQEDDIRHLVLDLLFLSRQPAEQAGDEAVRFCIRFFEQNDQTKISLGELAQKVHLSKQSLIARFKKATGLTPIEYLIRLRIRKAKSLLLNSSLSVTQIAQLCGFENVYYFSGRFKQLENVSPAGYRKMHEL